VRHRYPQSGLKNAETMILKWVNTKGRTREQRGRRISVPYCKVFILLYQIHFKICSYFPKGICGRISSPHYTFTFVTKREEIHKAKSLKHTHTAGQDANGSLAVHTAVERQASVQVSGVAADLYRQHEERHDEHGRAVELHCCEKIC